MSRTHMEKWAETKDIRQRITDFLIWWQERNGLPLVSPEDLDITLAHYLGIDLEAVTREKKLMEMGRAAVHQRGMAQTLPAPPPITTPAQRVQKAREAGQGLVVPASSVGRLSQPGPRVQELPAAPGQQMQRTMYTEVEVEGTVKLVVSYRDKPLGIFWPDLQLFTTGGTTRLMLYHKRNVINLPMSVWRLLMQKECQWLEVVIYDYHNARYRVSMAVATEKGIPYDDGLGARWGIPARLFQVLNADGSIRTQTMAALIPTLQGFPEAPPEGQKARNGGRRR